VDEHVAKSFPSLDEYVKRMEGVNERNAEISRKYYMEYAKKHIIPRVAIGSGLIPSLVPREDSSSGL